MWKLTEFPTKKAMTNQKAFFVNILTDKVKRKRVEE